MPFARCQDDKGCPFNHVAKLAPRPVRIPRRPATSGGSDTCPTKGSDPDDRPATIGSHPASLSGCLASARELRRASPRGERRLGDQLRADRRPAAAHSIPMDVQHRPRAPRVPRCRRPRHAAAEPSDDRGGPCTLLAAPGGSRVQGLEPCHCGAPRRRSLGAWCSRTVHIAFHITTMCVSSARCEQYVCEQTRSHGHGRDPITCMHTSTCICHVNRQQLKSALSNINYDYVCK
jgi:hypothetical protein